MHIRGKMKAVFGIALALLLIAHLTDAGEGGTQGESCALQLTNTVPANLILWHCTRLFFRQFAMQILCYWMQQPKC